MNEQPSLFELLLRLQWLLRHRHGPQFRGQNPLAAAHQGQGRVLALLKLKPELSQKELATILAIRPQSLGELLSKLERQGLVTRTPSPDDARSQVVRITEAGLAASEQQGNDESAGLFACLSDEEKAGLAATLQRLITAWEAELGPEEAWTRDFGPHHGRGYGPPRGPHGFGGPADHGHGFDPRGHRGFHHRDF